MNFSFKKHLIDSTATVTEALERLNELNIDSVLFVIDPNFKLIGSISDGDIRRGLIRGLDLNTSLIHYASLKPIVTYKNHLSKKLVKEFKRSNYKIIPILDEEDRVVDVLNLRTAFSIIPVDVVIMAGGRGERLQPLTNTVPKPMLPVGDKPILEHNIDLLRRYGISSFHISINYLGNVIRNYFGDGSQKGIQIQYICEDKPLGTLGSIVLAKELKQEYILIINSDILTDIDYGDFFESFLDADAQMAIAACSYNFDVPYAVLETNDNNEVVSLKEKPRISFFSNAGIYIVRKSLLEMIPKDQFFNVTDLIEKLISINYKVHTYEILTYWLDIGKHEDYRKANEDIRHLKDLH